MDRKKLGFILITAALLLLPLALSGTDGSFAATSMGVKEGQKAPDFSLKALDGKTYTLSDQQGKKIIMLEFWATWCGVCKTEIPELIKDYTSLKDKGFDLWAVTLQTGEVADVKEIVDKNNIPYPVLLDESLTVATKVYKLAGPIPLKVIIDGNGIVRYSHVGDYPPGENEVPDVVMDLIKETLPPPVDLNKADAKALETTLGVNPSVAEAIIKGRPYQSVEEAGNKVKEIRLEMVKHLLFVTGAKPLAPAKP